MGRNRTTAPPITKEMWQDPEWLARRKIRDQQYLERLKNDPWAVSSYGIPKGLKKKEAIPLWRAAHALADKYLDYMKKTDQAPSDMDVKVIERKNVIPYTEMVVPESDEEKAVVALREAFLLAIGPISVPEKLKALSLVMQYTKPKPESSTKLRVERAEDFLDLIAEVQTIDTEAD